MDRDTLLEKLFPLTLPEPSRIRVCQLCGEMAYAESNAPLDFVCESCSARNDAAEDVTAHHCEICTEQIETPDDGKFGWVCARCYGSLEAPLPDLEFLIRGIARWRFLSQQDDASLLTLWGAVERARERALTDAEEDEASGEYPFGEAVLEQLQNLEEQDRETLQRFQSLCQGEKLEELCKASKYPKASRVKSAEEAEKKPQDTDSSAGRPPDEQVAERRTLVRAAAELYKDRKGELDKLTCKYLDRHDILVPEKWAIFHDVDTWMGARRHSEIRPRVHKMFSNDRKLGEKSSPKS